MIKTVLLSGRWPRVNARPLVNFLRPMAFVIYNKGYLVGLVNLKCKSEWFECKRSETSRIGVLSASCKIRENFVVPAGFKQVRAEVTSEVNAAVAGIH